MGWLDKISKLNGSLEYSLHKKNKGEINEVFY
jgi:hypothetical protein